MTTTNEDLVALSLVPTPRGARRLARTLLALLVFVVCALTFAPWQQSSAGAGRVIAYAPLDRQQHIEAPIDGRVVRWHVREGAHVEAGDAIADIADNDPEILVRLHQERDAQQARIDAAKARAASIESRIASLEASRGGAVAGAGRRVDMAKKRVQAAERAVAAAEAAGKTAKANVERVRGLAQQGLRSTRDLELAELDTIRADTDLDRATAARDGANAELAAIEADQLKVDNDGAAAIDDARAQRALAAAEVASATGELARIEVRLARQHAQSIVAPRAGTVLRLLANQGTEMVKPGEPIAILVPDTESRAVELWIDGNDVPLVWPGRHVRLQFEGWPAVQFTGWPSVAVGSFGGKVAFVDATDDGAGRFRVVVVPDGEPWPSAQYLRQGTQANGWILLERVGLGYELWRRFNGFPPAMKSPAQVEKSK